VLVRELEPDMSLGGLDHVEKRAVEMERDYYLRRPY